MCSCLNSSFIRLADYLIVNTMHVLAFNSVKTLLNYFLEQLKETPAAESIMNLQEDKPSKAEERVCIYVHRIL